MEQGRVRAEDRLGNIEADTAADLGRKHQPEEVMDVRRAWSMLGIFGIPLCGGLIGSRLLSPRFLLIMMGGVALRQISLSGIRAVGLSSVKLTC